MAVDVESGDYEIADDTLRAGAGHGSEEGTSPEVEAVNDTRFDGELTIPAKTIRWLGYPYTDSAGRSWSAARPAFQSSEVASPPSKVSATRR